MAPGVLFATMSRQEEFFLVCMALQAHLCHESYMRKTQVETALLPKSAKPRKSHIMGKSS
jgi:hypothetical protein